MHCIALEEVIKRGGSNDDGNGIRIKIECDFHDFLRVEPAAGLGEVRQRGVSGKVTITC